MIRTALFFFIMISLNIFAENDSLLNDQAEMNLYINSFPFEQYKIYEVPGQGKFYLDEPKDMIKDVLRKGNAWEGDLIAYINLYAKPGSVVIDIGAHIGAMTVILANAVGTSGRVHAFEPQKKLFRELVYNIALNEFIEQVEPHRYAIGDKHSIIQMNRATPCNEGGTGVGVGGDFVEMRTLDSFEFQNVSLMKIDVERTEDEVIDGMINTINQNKPVILIEIQGGYTMRSAPLEIRAKISRTIRKLESCGYNVRKITFHDYLATPK